MTILKEGDGLDAGAVHHWILSANVVFLRAEGVGG